MQTGSEISGRINSIQTLGTLDGPGVRYVVFVQGCNLRCGCCHNPDTWSLNNGKVLTAVEIAQKVLNYRDYFGKDGGITVSGGEPLLQSDFVAELFRLCKQQGINTCLDTSGSILDNRVKKLLDFTDYVMLDIKYTTDELYKKHVGCSIEKPIEFLEYLDKKKKLTRIRQVIIPGLNDDEENIRALAEIINRYKCIEKAELLAFRKTCEVKYKQLSVKFPFANYPEPSQNLILSLEEKLHSLTHFNK